MSWISVAGKPRKKALADLCLVDSGQQAPAGSAPAAGAMTVDGSAFIVVFDDFWPPAMQPAFMERLSEGGLVVGCSEAEDQNTSLAFLFRGGERLWEVSHVLDEGDLHLAVKGKPPHALAGLVARARQRLEKHGNDAMFSVPAALAAHVSGFSRDRCRELSFTRLDTRPAADFQQLADAAMACASDVLKAEGFQPRPSNPHVFVRDTAQERIQVNIWCSTGDPRGVDFGAVLRVCNQQVQSFQDPGCSITETASFTLSRLMSVPSSTATLQDLDTLQSVLRRELPVVLRRLCSIKELDRLVNDGGPRFNVLNQPTLSHYDASTGYSRIILAYLASNRSFAQMVKETAGGDAAHGVHEVVARLRARGVPMG